MYAHKHPRRSSRELELKQLNSLSARSDELSSQDEGGPTILGRSSSFSVDDAAQQVTTATQATSSCCSVKVWLFCCCQPDDKRLAPAPVPAPVPAPDAELPAAS
jgi:hypothetical protein